MPKTYDPDTPMVTCLICGKKVRNLAGKHLKFHGMTTKEYLERFPGAEIMAADALHKIKNRKTGDLSDEARKALSQGKEIMSDEKQEARRYEIDEKGLPQVLRNFLNRVTSRGFARYVKRDPVLLQEIEKLTSGMDPNTHINERAYMILHPNADPVCKYGKRRIFWTLDQGFKKMCSRSRKECRCSSEAQSDLFRRVVIEDEEVRKRALEASRQSNIENRSEILGKMKQTCLDRYGVPHPMLDDAIKRKVIETSKERNGGVHHTQSLEWKEKHKDIHREVMKIARQAYVDQTGYTNPSYSPQFKRRMWDKRYDRILELPNVTPLFSREDYTGALDEDGDPVLYPWKCNHCGHKWERSSGVNFLDCKICFPKEYGSSEESQVGDFLRSIGVYHEVGSRDVLGDGLELDIYSPEHKIGVEYCGLYWHAEEIVPERGENYHSRKADLAEERGIKLIQIFSDEWILKRDVCEKRLRVLFGIAPKGKPARSLDLEKIRFGEVSQFLGDNHLQGVGNNATDSWVLKDGDRIVAAMTFGPRRATIGKVSDSWEMYRFATDGDNHPGAASRLFKAFINDQKPNRVLSYSDRRWGDGGLYEKLGFNMEAKTKPNYFYTDDFSTRYTRHRFQKHKLVEMGAPKEMTEAQIALELGFFKIWDAGNKRFVWSNY